MISKKHEKNKITMAVGKEITYEEHIYDEALEMYETLKSVNARNANDRYGRRASVRDTQPGYDNVQLPQSTGLKRNDTRWLKGMTVVLAAVTVVLIAVIIFLGIRDGTADFTTTTARFSGCQAQHCLLECGNPPRYKTDQHGCDVCLCDFGMQPPLPTTLTTNYEKNSSTPSLYKTAALTTTTPTVITTTTAFDADFQSTTARFSGCQAQQCLLDCGEPPRYKKDQHGCDVCLCDFGFAQPIASSSATRSMNTPTSLYTATTKPTYLTSTTFFNSLKSDFTTTTARSSGCQAQQCLLDCGNPPRYKIDHHGCDICLCDFGVQPPLPTTLTTNYERNSPTPTLYNTAALTTTTLSANTTTTVFDGVCPPFPDNCPSAPGCAAFDANFCPKCNCGDDFTTTTARFSGCQAQHCLLDCGNPPRYKKDQHGCDVCLCDFGFATLIHELYTATTKPTSLTTITLLNGVCPPFPDDCPSRPGCASFDANFCPKCNCGAEYESTTARFIGCQVQACLLDCGNPPKYKKDQHGCDVCLCDFG